MKPQEFSIQSIGQPPRPSAFARFIGLARGFTGYTIFLGVVVIGGEKVLAPEYKPSRLMGSFVGDIEKAEIIAKQQVLVENTRRMTEAQTIPQGNMAIEVEINRQQQQVMADSLAGQSAMANLADWGCALGALVPRDASDGWQTIGAIARSGCGASSRIRENIVREQAGAGRRGASIQARQPDVSDVNRDPDGIRSAATAPRMLPSLNEFLATTARPSRYEPPEVAEQRKYYPKD